MAVTNNLHGQPTNYSQTEEEREILLEDVFRELFHRDFANPEKVDKNISGCVELMQMLRKNQTGNVGSESVQSTTPPNDEVDEIDSILDEAYKDYDKQKPSNHTTPAVPSIPQPPSDNEAQENLMFQMAKLIVTNMLCFCKENPEQLRQLVTDQVKMMFDVSLIDKELLRLFLSAHNIDSKHHVALIEKDDLLVELDIVKFKLLLLHQEFIEPIIKFQAAQIKRPENVDKMSVSQFCVSPQQAEVFGREMTKGLVIHYKLDG